MYPGIAKGFVRKQVDGYGNPVTILAMLSHSIDLDDETLYLFDVRQVGEQLILTPINKHKTDEFIGFMISQVLTSL